MVTFPFEAKFRLELMKFGIRRFTEVDLARLAIVADENDSNGMETQFEVGNKMYTRDASILDTKFVVFV